jgi:hypothetical protein
VHGTFIVPAAAAYRAATVRERMGGNLTVAAQYISITVMAYLCLTHQGSSHHVVSRPARLFHQKQTVNRHPTEDEGPPLSFALLPEFLL